jgi:hypothetical protein
LTAQYLQNKPVELWTLSDLTSSSSELKNGLTPEQIRILISNIGLDAIRIFSSTKNPNFASSAIVFNFFSKIKIILLKIFKKP